MPLKQRETVSAAPKSKPVTARPHEHSLCGSVVRVRQDQDGWRLADEEDDYEHATVEQVWPIRGVDYAYCYVRPGGVNSNALATVVVPVSALPEYLVTATP